MSERRSCLGNVAMPELLTSITTSPSRCLGTDRSTTSAARSLIMTSGVMKFLPRPWVLARGTRDACSMRRHATNSRFKDPHPWMNSACSVASRRSSSCRQGEWDTRWSGLLEHGFRWVADSRYCRQLPPYGPHVYEDRDGLSRVGRAGRSVVKGEEEVSPGRDHIG